jgi:hypothetical protein
MIDLGNSSQLWDTRAHGKEGSGAMLYEENLKEQMSGAAELQQWDQRTKQVTEPTSGKQGDIL